MGEIQFFGRLDRKGGRLDGEVVSQYPSWFLERQADELRENMGSLERSLENGEIPPESVGRVRAEIKEMKAKVDVIDGDRPNLEAPGVRDTIAKTYKEIGKQIADAMFTRIDMEKGLADAHEEARRLSSPVIELSPEVLEVARGCNVRISDDGRISRKDAEKMYQICGKAIGEDMNPERLRKDGRR